MLLYPRVTAPALESNRQDILCAVASWAPGSLLTVIYSIKRTVNIRTDRIIRIHNNQKPSAVLLWMLHYYGWPQKNCCSKLCSLLLLLHGLEGMCEGFPLSGDERFKNRGCTSNYQKIRCKPASNFQFVHTAKPDSLGWILTLLLMPLTRFPLEMCPWWSAGFV